MKIMAVDVGSSRTGLAICDKMEMLASPLTVLNEKNFDICISMTAEAAKVNHAEMIVVGLPKHMNNDIGEKAKLCMEFAEKLRSLVSVPVEMWDERCTTVIAHNYLNNTNTRGKKRKAVVDAVAATLILESYLGYRKNSGKFH